MPVKIFIDANLILNDIYRAGDDNALKTLKELVKLKSLIFMTEQILLEVTRNALQVVAAKCEEQRIKNLQLEARLGSAAEADLSEKLKQAKSACAEFTKSMEDFLLKRIKETSLGTDPFSVELADLFASPAQATEDQVKRARFRKERGCPPGKRDDPLGDQLSWEQFLDVVKEDMVLICTRDQDYFQKAGKGCYLNLLLVAELSQRGVDPASIHVFDNLKDLLKFAEDNKLAEVSAESIDYPQGQYPPLLDFSGNAVTACPVCGGRIVVQHAQIRTAEGIMFGPICERGHLVPMEHWD